jgi:hypothetical protein
MICESHAAYFLVLFFDKILYPYLFMNQKYCNNFILSILFISIVMLTACYNDNEEELYATTTTTTTCDLTTAVKFSTVVSPIITSKCASSGCHSTTSKAAGINLGNYDAVKAYITSSKVVFLGSIKRTSGYSIMPKGDAKLPDCDISKIESWITAAMPNN